LANYNLDDQDIEVLLAMTRERIGTARVAADTNDDDLAHLYTLKGKLLRIQTSRGGAEKPAPKKTRKKATPQPEEIAPAVV